MYPAVLGVEILVRVIIYIQILYITCLFVMLLYVPVNSFCNGGKVSSPNHTFSWASLEQGVN